MTAAGLGQPCGLPEQSFWQPQSEAKVLSDWVAGQSVADLTQLHQQLQHELRENGSDGEPWQSGSRTLDCTPWLISDTEWQQLERGLAQRHRLLAAVVADLYGPQQLLHSNMLPADLLYLSGNYLLPVCGLLSEPSAWLPLLSADVGRNAAGEFCVLDDFSQLPDGLGYLLEHRLAFNHCGSQLPALQKAQLAGFFRQLLQVLQQPALSQAWPINTPAQTADRSSLVGLLAPVAKNAGYFEQAFLANYLDIALVHGADLMFKDGRLWLKTLTGLQPVASLLRYLADAKTDPLELDAAGSGCAGLLQSIRQQQLFCANPPGTALLDAGLLLPFMPALCQALLGEPLLLPTVPALWLGEEASLQQFWSAPTHYRIVDQRDCCRYHLNTMAQADFSALKQQISQQPNAYIAIELQPLSTLDCWRPGFGEQKLAGQLRLFSLYQPNHSSVLPGAYARLAENAHVLQCGEIPQAALTVKDVWVLADRGQTSSLLQSSAQQLSLSRQSGLVPSRVADHLFWLGRYNERLNLICRALRSALPLMATPQHAPEAGQDALALLRFCLKANGSQWVSADHLPLTELMEQMFQPQNATGIVAVLKHLLFNAQSVREYFGEDTWYVLDKLQTAIYQWPQQLKWQQPAALLRQLDDIILLQTAIYGLNNETMSRTQTLRMMDVGQHLERALQTSALLQTVFVPPQPAPATSAALMEAVLRMADTLMTYRRRYRSELHPLAIIDLLLLDETTPRSVGYQCARIQRQCAKLPQLAASTMLSPEQRISLELVSLLQLVDPQSLFDADQHATPALGMLLNQLQHRLRQLSDSITLSYFNHAQQHSAWQSF